MRESGRTAIGRWAARGKQYLVQVRVVEHGMVLQQLLHSEEVRSFDEIEIPKAKLNDTELQLAKQLIDSITTDSGFEPSKYHDDVKERIEQMIAQKVSGREITAPEAPAAPEGARVIDLMQALRASLKAGPKVAAKAAGRSAEGAEAGPRANHSKGKPARPAKKAAPRRTLKRVA
jgi:DNA end-binding protein Ku